MPTRSSPAAVSPTTAYAALERRFARLTAIEDSIAFLHWDQSAVMPAGGASSRADQLATLAGLHHDLLTAPDTAEMIALADPLAEAESAEDGAWRLANLAEITRLHAHAMALPGDLVEALSRAGNACERVWREARPLGDFALVEGPLGQLLGLVRDSAAAKAEALGVAPYDALLDQYEPGGSSARIDEIFDDLEAFLPDFLGRVIERQGAAAEAPAGPFPIPTQQAVGRATMESLGFDFDHGRLDVSLHPFCGGSPQDLRLTTRYDEADFTSALMGVIHETGHALYEQGLPRDRLSQPVGRARGMSVHESQSLLFEMQAGRSRAFISHCAPAWKAAFGGEGEAWRADSLYRHFTRVEPGFIRVDADEVTYPAHVIVRYRLEKALIEGRMALGDLPAAWNDAMERLLGVRPPNDRLGCLQDIHWYDGAWGYFPTYTLGAMTAAQVFDAASRAVPDIGPAIGRGDFTPLLGWLRTHIHAKGCRLSTDALLREATGRPLDASVFKAHLTRRYLEDR
ncbi:carboxypeptidase M32 [Rhodospirillum rubrum]|uniref:carboxypeptidase M32 n=1 Tax=Rhodospirillum rubrum TaxID=1085 RepID=UPI001905851F|nr:carboxypeptidase M32 [Rhodospirillum rubrum]MBK1665736.1 carboxypeptidase M32 [Rhodospirillum rubrum]MBK1677601.1 carboxypeptidase M32 [Rhodospirillum rubrum]